jgi:hypothetical protein
MSGEEKMRERERRERERERERRGINKEKRGESIIYFYFQRNWNNMKVDRRKRDYLQLPTQSQFTIVHLCCVACCVN